MSWVIASNIAQRVKELRRALSSKPGALVSQEDLGRRAGVRPSQVSQWERGVQQPSRSRLERWAEREGWPVTIFAEGSAGPGEVLAAAVGRAGGSATVPAWTSGGGNRSKADSRGSADPDAILARFYRLMAAAAEHGHPWPPELAQLVHEMHGAAKAGGSSSEFQAGQPGADTADSESDGDASVSSSEGSAVPGW